jgi:UDPglucose 6-dehydrogenase
MDTEHITVVGLGKLGLCFAASLAVAGYNVRGVDINENLVKQVNDGVSPHPEPKLQSYLNQVNNRLTATTDTTKAVINSDATFVFVNTPLSEDGEHSVESVLAVCRTLGKELPSTDGYHVVTIRSTVMPGAVNGPIRETLEETSGLMSGKDFGLCYNPEFTAIGEIIDGLERPDFFLVGEQTEQAGDVVTDVCKQIRDNNAPIHRTRLESAELAKMVNNTYRTMKISFANTIGQITESINADIDELMTSLESDSIINTRYLEPAARYGGPCYSRDNEAFVSLAENTGAAPDLASATDAVNDQHTKWIANAVRQLIDDGTVTILGLSYKPGTPIAEDSAGVDLAAELAHEFDIVCTDPEAIPDARERINVPVKFEDTESAISCGDVVIITTPWDEYTDPELYAGFEHILLDLWRCFEIDTFETVDYRPFGKGNFPGTLLK